MSKADNILDLTTLVPIEAKFSFSTAPEKTLTLCRFSLRVRTWAFNKYGAERLQEAFEKHRMIEISEIAYFMLKEKDLFKDKDGKESFDEFLDACSSMQDQINLSKAVLQSVGIGEPEIKKIQANLEKKTARAASQKNP